jgi:hypothetical protein
MKDTSWNTPYIHGTEQEADETSQASQLDTVFTVHLDHRKDDYTPESFLQACWTNGFDTSCTVCREGFDLATEPPVRLLSLGQHTTAIDPLGKQLPPLFVENYHLRCLKANQVKFIPVSHPWHSSVAEAYALRTFNAKAAQTCYEAPIRTLLAVTRRFGSDCLLWHDYISIPQWQDDFRGTVILPQIFKIFETSGSAILHLQDQPPAEVVQTPTLGMISKHNSDLRRFFNAHLFTRLWPIVEADRAGEAYIMNSEYEIMESKFSKFVQQILDAMNVGATTMSYEQVFNLQWIDHLPLFIQERQKTKCLGYVYDMVADLGCRSFRDKFIGSAELLRISDYPTELPADTKGACLWLTKRQIESGDLSPLLLRPSTEPVLQEASWLKGHSVISRNMWAWGVQMAPARVMSRVQGNTVHIDLHLAGTIDCNLSWHLHTDEDPDGASKDLLRLITSTSGSATEFVKHLEDINPASIFYTSTTSNMERVPTMEYNMLSSKVILNLLDRLLQQQVLSRTAGQPGNSLSIYDDIVSLLALATSLPTPALDHFENFSLRQLRQQLCDSHEHDLVSVTCLECLKRSLFRVEMWQKPNTEARLYLIPGLTYQYTAKGGTGIIIEENRVIGRARFCASGCACSHTVPVELV